MGQEWSGLQSVLKRGAAWAVVSGMMLSYRSQRCGKTTHRHP